MTKNCCSPCTEEIPSVILTAAAPPGEANQPESSVDPFRFYDSLPNTFIVPSLDVAQGIPVSVHNSAAYFPGQYISIFDSASLLFAGLFRIVSIPGENVLMVVNTGVEGNLSAGSVVAPGSWVIAAPPPVATGLVRREDIEILAINGDRIDDGAIEARHLGPGIVGTAAIADGSITASKVAWGNLQSDRQRLSSAQTILRSTWTRIDFNSVLFESVAFWSSGDTGWKPTLAGLYAVYGAVAFSEPTAGQFFGHSSSFDVRVVLNASSRMRFGGIVPYRSSNQATQIYYTVPFSAMIRVNGTTDVISIQAYHQALSTGGTHRDALVGIYQPCNAGCCMVGP